MIGNLNKKDIIAIAYITILTIIAVVYGFSIIPSPASEQVYATDHKRVVDLANIQSAVDNYYQNNNTLPPTLDNLTTQAYDSSTPLGKTDPDTHQPYEYNETSPYSYTLCATFTTDSTKEQTNQYDATNVDYPVYKGNFTHPVGHFCFTEREQPPYQPPYPPIHPTIFPCRTGRMCPMIPADSSPSPAIYNGEQTTISPSPYQSVGNSPQ